METEKSPAQTALTEANEECSKICFEIGRLHWQMKTNRDELADMEIKFHNLEVDLEKATDRYKKAQKSAVTEYQAKQPTPAKDLELVQ